MFYEAIFKALEERDIRYLVAGGVAVILHGFVRTTVDLDLIVALREDNLQAFLALVKELGYRPKPPVPIEDFAKESNRKKWKDEKGMLVFSLFHPARPQELIDIFIDEPIPFDEAYSRRERVSTGEVEISVLSIADLIKLKTAAGREQDLEDVRALKELLSRRRP